METNRTFRFTPQLVLGLIVIFIGVIFTLNNIGLIDSEDYVKYWPTLLIAFGLVNLFQRQGASRRLWAGMWVLVGSALLLNNLDITHIRIWDFWPLFLILIGFGMMRSSTVRHRRWGGASGGLSVMDGGVDSDSLINGSAILGGYRRTCNSQDFRGGEFTAIMGGVELDLRDASIKSGEAILDVFAFWGGVKIRVPDDWTVSLQATPVLGGFEDKSRPPKADAGKRLVVKGMAIMGGVEIDN
jgi:predicted membrane protein